MIMIEVVRLNFEKGATSRAFDAVSGNSGVTYFPLSGTVLTFLEDGKACSVISNLASGYWQQEY